MAVVYVSQFQNSAGLWQRRLANGNIANGTSKTPYPGIRKENPGKGNN